MARPLRLPHLQQEPPLQVTQPKVLRKLLRPDSFQAASRCCSGYRSIGIPSWRILPSQSHGPHTPTFIIPGSHLLKEKYRGLRLPGTFGYCSKWLDPAKDSRCSSDLCKAWASSILFGPQVIQFRGGPSEESVLLGDTVTLPSTVYQRAPCYWAIGYKYFEREKNLNSLSKLFY